MHPNPDGASGLEQLSGQHRNLFNGDFSVFFYNPEKWQPEDFRVEEREGRKLAAGGPFKPVAIHRYVDTLADNGIDTFLVNANGCRAWYPSKGIPTILDGYTRGDREYFRGHGVHCRMASPIFGQARHPRGFTPA